MCTVYWIVGALARAKEFAIVQATSIHSSDLFRTYILIVVECVVLTRTLCCAVRCIVRLALCAFCDGC